MRRRTAHVRNCEADLRGESRRACQLLPCRRGVFSELHGEVRPTDGEVVDPASALFRGGQVTRTLETSDGHTQVRLTEFGGRRTRDQGPGVGSNEGAMRQLAIALLRRARRRGEVGKLRRETRKAISLGTSAPPADKLGWGARYLKRVVRRPVSFAYVRGDRDRDLPALR